MRSTIFSTLTLAAAMLLGACGDDSLTAPSTTRSTAIGPDIAKGGGKGKGVKPSNRIVYTHKDANGFTDIYSMNPDGGNVGRLTPASGYNGSPRWTADRTKIVFVSSRAGAENIFIMNADGSNVVQLTFGGCADRNPAPSPDGTRIVFQRACAGGGLFIMNIDGSNPTQHTFNSSHKQPSWSPDGSKIMFASTENAIPGIWKVNSDSPTFSLVYACGVNPCSNPMYSPDGTKVAFWSSVNEGEIIVASSLVHDGPILLELAHLGAGSEYAPTWSPDGTKLVFTAGLFGTDVELYSVNSADGLGLTKLTSVVGPDAAPSWHR